MSEPGDHEGRLVDACGDLVSPAAELADAIETLEGWLQGLQQALRERRPLMARVWTDDHPLAREVGDIDDLMQTAPSRWAQRWSLLQPAKDLAASFESRIMLLVFGKFNAGKSSLCNLLADRFVAHGREVSYFHLAEGRIVQAGHRFQEGATETTSRLQGVCLGEGLVLLDTPGLHSMTPENAELTRRFTDSADAMLWLSSSTSPGQVQELDELGRELHRNKPLLPVITRSDVFEEDEVDGDIVKRLRNKSSANRQLQEGDVRERALGKLAQMNVPASVLQAPISVSVRAAREAGLTTAALHDSGLDRLYAAIARLVEPATAYKRRKPVEVLLHHLEETVAGGVCMDLLPAVKRQAGHLASEQERLSTLKKRLTSLVWRQVASGVAGAMHGCESADALPQACRTLEDGLQETLDRAWPEHLCDYMSPHRDAAPTPRLEIDASGDFDFQRAHDELQAALRQLVGQRLDAAFAPLSKALDDMLQWNRALQGELGRQVAALKQIKADLRTADRAVMSDG